MSEHIEMPSEVGIEWEREVRGYNRQQVDNYVAWRAGQVRELESRLSQSLAEIERLRHELGEARSSAGRPAHEEISERVGQILKLAADEARADREKGAADANDLRSAAQAEVESLKADVKQETDRLRTEAQERAERILTAAQEQADRAVSTARAEAEEMVSSAHATAEQTVAEANSHAENTVTTALAQAKQQLDEATARATAIHDGAERRLNLLISRHTETVRRLTEIRDVVTGLVAGETARGSLEDEVNRALGLPANGATGQHDQGHSGPRRTHRQADAADGRRHAAPPVTADGPGEPAGQPEVPVQMAKQDPPEHPEDDPVSGSLPVPRDGAGYEQDGRRHVTDAAMRAAEELRQAAAKHRHEPDHEGTAEPVPERVLDETAAAGGRSIDS